MGLHGSIKNMNATLQKYSKTFWAHCTEINTFGLRKLCSLGWNEIKKETGVNTVGELLRLVVCESFKQIMVRAVKSLFEFAVKYTFPRLGEWVTPLLFIRTRNGAVCVQYFVNLMARHPYVDSAEIILCALQHASDSFRAEIFTRSVTVQSRYYTDKLIPPEVSKTGIVALIKQNNMPLLARVLTKNNLTFTVASAAVLRHEKLLETFESHVDLSQVLNIIDVENWRDYGVHIRKDDKNDMLAVYQNKLLMREISKIDEHQGRIQRRRM